MVKKTGGDIEGLFRSFGGDGGAYRELAREADAREAQARWPMLGEIAPEAGERPEALDAAGKRHWRERVEASGDALLPPPQVSAEGRRLVGGLDHLLARGRAREDSPAAPAITAWGGRHSPSAEAPAPVPAPPRAPSRPSRRAEPRRPESKEAPGLFGARHAGAKVEKSGPAGALSGLFSRLEGDGRGARPLTPGRLRIR